MREIEKRNMEQGQYATIAASDIAEGASPFTQQQEQAPMEQQPMQ
jgi:hypothetical protein